MTTRQKPKEEKRHILDTLPFTRKKSDGSRDYWSVMPTGHMRSDDRSGMNLACVWLEFERDRCTDHIGFVLPDIIRDMVRKGDDNRLAFGFIHAIDGFVSMAIAHNPEIVSDFKRWLGERQLPRTTSPADTDGRKGSGTASKHGGPLERARNRKSG